MIEGQMGRRPDLPESTPSTEMCAESWGFRPNLTQDCSGPLGIVKERRFRIACSRSAEFELLVAGMAIGPRRLSAWVE
jgi:hypothetical protein